MAAGRSTAYQIAAKNCRYRHVYFQQLIGSRYRHIQRYRQLFTTYRLATIHLLQLKRRLRDDISYPRLNLTVGYSKGNKIITVDFYDSREILFLKSYFNANLFYFFAFIYF